MYKRKSKLKELLIADLVETIRIQSLKISESINLIKNYGNPNKRKKQKFSLYKFNSVAGSILSMPIQIECMRNIINSKKSLYKKYITLLKEVQEKMEQQVKENMQAQQQQITDNKG